MTRRPFESYHGRYQISTVVLRAAEELSAARAVVDLLPLPFAQVRSLRPDEDWMRRLHACIMRGGQAGRPRERSDYRRNTVQIGNFTYLPPAWEDVPRLMAELADWATEAIDEWVDYFCARLGEAARHMRLAIEDNFRERHPDLLDDPLIELPDNLRRVLVGLEPLDQHLDLDRGNVHRGVQWLDHE